MSTLANKEVPEWCIPNSTNWLGEALSVDGEEAGLEIISSSSWNIVSLDGGFEGGGILVVTGRGWFVVFSPGSVGFLLFFY